MVQNLRQVFNKGPTSNLAPKNFNQTENIFIHNNQLIVVQIIIDSFKIQILFLTTFLYNFLIFCSPLYESPSSAPSILCILIIIYSLLVIPWSSFITFISNYILSFLHNFLLSHSYHIQYFILLFLNIFILHILTIFNFILLFLNIFILHPVSHSFGATISVLFPFFLLF